MKKVFQIFIVVLFIEPQISNSLVWLDYEFHKDYITKTFCVNKEKPELKCNGKCHLAKQLSEPVSTESSEPVEIVFVPQIQLFFQGANDGPLEQKEQPEETMLKEHVYTYLPVFKIDEPPKA